MFKPLADYLGKQIGREVKLVTSKNFSEFWKAVQSKQFDLVHYNHLHYIESQSDYRVILMNQEFGDNKISGAIAVRKDSNINSIDDLRGKKILFGGDKSALIAYIINTYYLRKNGLNEGDYEELFAKNPPNATLSMYHKRVDAAGIGNIGLKIPLMKKDGVDISEVKLFITSKPLSHLPWAVKVDLDPKLVHKIQTVLSQLGSSSKGQQLLKNARLTGLVEASDSDYDEIREIVKEYRQLVLHEMPSKGQQAKIK